MPKLRDYFFLDNDTFFNPNEFGTIEEIDGKPVIVVIDDDQLKKHNLQYGGEGLAKGELLFHVKKSDIEKPHIGMRMTFNKKPYKVLDIAENSGMYTITLVRFVG
jgi:hypothetical protein